MNLHEPEIKLTLNVDLDDEYGKTVNAPYFQERADVCDHGVQICAKGLHRYVRLPKGTTEITVVFFKRHVAESFEIGRRVVKAARFEGFMSSEIRAYCLLDHPNVELLQSFRSELYRYYINGYKFFRIEY